MTINTNQGKRVQSPNITTARWHFAAVFNSVSFAFNTLKQKYTVHQMIPTELNNKIHGLKTDTSLFSITVEYIAYIQSILNSKFLQYALTVT
jgi:stress-induced morphogen